VLVLDDPILGDRGDPFATPKSASASGLGVENPQCRYTEKRPFESWVELDALVGKLGPRHGPMVLFTAATWLRRGEWLALEHRDIDRDAQVLYAQPQPEARAEGAGITPLRRVYDLRHAFATFALGAGICTFDLSRYVVTETEMRRLLKVCDGKDFASRRDAAMLRLFYDTGIRRNELDDLTVRDIDFDLDVVVVTGKGRRTRAAPFGKKTALALSRYNRRLSPGDRL
jgi:hypothetical protein